MGETAAARIRYPDALTRDKKKDDEASARFRGDLCGIEVCCRFYRKLQEASVTHLALVAPLVGGLDAADGEGEAALVLEEERAEPPVRGESVRAHREDVDVAVADPRNLGLEGHQKEPPFKSHVRCRSLPLPLGYAVLAA